MADYEDGDGSNDFSEEPTADESTPPLETGVNSHDDEFEQFNESENGRMTEKDDPDETTKEADAAPSPNRSPVLQPSDDKQTEAAGRTEETEPDDSKTATPKDGEEDKLKTEPGTETHTPISDLERKIFVGGLSWETTSQDVKDYFSKYGTVLECTLKTDPSTGRSRGFAFVLFEDPISVDKVFSQPIHMLHDRKIDPKKALARGGRDPIKKVFVGGLPPELPIEEVKEYFGKYGKVVEIEQPFDRVKNQRRAFIFITFESEEIVEQVVANPKQVVGGKEVDVRKATPKVEPDKNRGNSNNRGPPGTEGWPAMPPGYPPPPGYEYYGGYYPQPYGAYPPGYDYSGYYDYSAYYAHAHAQPPADWSSYAAAGAPPAYPQPYPGYDYSSWYGTGQPGAQDQNSQAGKMKRGSSTAPYHPYSR